MVKHIVFFNLKEDVDKAAAVEIARSHLEPLVGKIPGLLRLEVRQTYAGMDFVLYSEFENRETADGYADHPLHLEAKSHFFHLLSGRAAADYEL